MKNLKNSIINDIKSEIIKSRNFTINDFEFNFPDYGDKLAEIIFIPYDDYKLIIQDAEVKKEQKSGIGITLSLTYETKNVIQLVSSPGEYKNEEITNYDSMSSCIYQIKNWLGNIHSELKNSTININNISDDVMNDIKEKLNKKFTDEKEVFSKEEIEDITLKLNNLQKKVNKLEEELKISKDDNIKIKNIIQQSTDNLSIYPKKSWYFTTLNKFRNLNNDIKILLELKDSISNMIDYFK